MITRQFNEMRVDVSRLMVRVDTLERPTRNTKAEGERLHREMSANLIASRVFRRVITATWIMFSVTFLAGMVAAAVFGAMFH